MLQDPALAIHPPLLYMGYVGFSVAFAFACAAMLEGKLDQVWARWTRPWTTMAWAFLSVGIALGSWWAYYELGWGGYWFWDPVENASFMPWLVGTALIHSLAATEKRGLFKSWTLLLAILAFSLELVRHLPRAFGRADVGAFVRGRSRRAACSSSRSSSSWSAARSRCTPGARRCSNRRPASKPTAREAFLLYNNILLVVAAAMVLVGTLAPLIADAIEDAAVVGGRAVLTTCCSRGHVAAGGAGGRRHPCRVETRSARQQPPAHPARVRRRAGRSGWRWCSWVYGPGKLAHAGGHGARHLDHPVVAVRSRRPAAAAGCRCRAP